MASTKSRTEDKSQPDNLKINLIFPCTGKHIKKYSQQGLRWVTETPEIYQNHVQPYMQKQRDAGRLDWIFNIIEGRAEQEDIMYREHGDEGFLVSPDLNWDRKTITSLHLLALVERRDIWSLRDLTPNHVVWLKHMRQKILNATTKVYSELDQDQLKLYVHCRLPHARVKIPANLKRSTNLLPFSYPHRARYARSRSHTSCRQSIGTR